MVCRAILLVGLVGKEEYNLFMLCNLVRRVFFIAFLVVFFGFYVPSVSAQTGLSISNISDNKSSYPNSQIPKYEKFEITFQIQNTVAQNLNFAYEPNTSPYPGSENYPFDQGIAVDAEFLPPGQSDWTRAYTQPAFYYQDFLDETHPSQWGTDWYYPTTNYYWKVRYAPNQAGTWQYRLKVQDASGTVISSSQGFEVVNSENKGFIRVSQMDKRYFEFEDGTYFPALGYNMNYNHIQWIDPEADSPTSQGDNIDHFRAMGDNGIQLIRVWLSQWSIFGSHWNPWRDAASNGNDPPWTWLMYDPGTNPVTEFAFQISSNPSRCFMYGLNSPHPPVKPNTRYRLRVNYKTLGIEGPAVNGQPYGFVVKFTNTSDNCNLAASGSKITPVQPNNVAAWQTLEGNFTTQADQRFLDFIVLALENVSAGMAEVRYVWIEEDLGNGQYGSNILPKPFMDHHRYFDQRNSFAFDKVVNMAEEYGVYLRPVVLDWREEILASFGWNGLYTASPNSAYLYGPTDGSVTRSRWLQKQWWRYLQARWGYSTAIHSWEFVNEGTPGTEHAVAADLMGRYFHQFTPRHLSATSVWNGTTSSWNLSNYPGIDFGDVHCYNRRSGSACVPLEDFYDAAQATIDAASLWGPQNSARWPVIRGETGFVNSDNLDPNLDIHTDRNGVWLHNFLWGGLNSNGLIESYWFENWHIYDCPGGPPCSIRMDFDHRHHFKDVFDFVKNIPLNLGGYQNLAATVSDANVRVVGQKNPSTNRAHLWIQNKRHTWCAVSGNISGCPQVWDSSRLAGSVIVAGFSANAILPVEWWYFDTNTGLTRPPLSSLTTDSQGNLVINLNNLPSSVADAGIKVGDYSQIGPSLFPSPTPTLVPVQGDANGDGRVDGIDYVIWLNHYDTTTSNGSSDADFNSDGAVDGIDYVIWLNHYD